MEHGVRTSSPCTSRARAPVASRAVRALQAAGIRDHDDQGRHADPAQRLPPAQAAPRVADVGERQEIRMARYSGPVCRLCRREGTKLFLKGDRCFSETSARRAPRVPARPARPGPPALLGLRRAAAREAEGEAHVRPAREAVRADHASRRESHEGSRRRESPAGRCSSGDSTTSCFAWASRPRAPRRASSSSTDTSLVNGRKATIPSVRCVKPGTTIVRSEKSREGRRASSVPSRHARGPLAVPQWLEIDKDDTSTGTVKARTRCARTSRCPSRSSSSSSSTRATSSRGPARPAAALPNPCSTSSRERRSDEELAPADPAAPPRKSRGGPRPTYGRFWCEPLERGFGLTLGNCASPRAALVAAGRRAITLKIRVEGVHARVHHDPGRPRRRRPTSCST